MHKDKIYEIIGKYLAGEATDKESNEFLDWINSSDENRKEFELHEKAWKATRIKFDAQNVDLVFRNVLNKIDGDQGHEISRIDKGDIKSRQVNFLMLAKVAASLIILAALAYVIFINSSTYSVEPQTVSIINKENPSGQKSKIFLPDGSEVWLNAESKISYPEKFSDSTRVVSVEGEAFFSVVKNIRKPFIVKTEDVIITVLGTSFNINAYDNEQNAYIALLSGKVKVDINNDHGAQQIYLEPGEGISYDRSSHLTVKETFDKDHVLGWKDGIINFKNASLEEVVSTLNRWYGVNISIVNSAPEQWTYNGPFVNENLDNVLKSIGFTKGFTHKFDEENPKKVTIKFN